VLQCWKVVSRLGETEVVAQVVDDVMVVALAAVAREEAGAVAVTL